MRVVNNPKQIAPPRLPIQFILPSHETWSVLESTISYPNIREIHRKLMGSRKTYVNGPEISGVCVELNTSIAGDVHPNEVP